MRLGCRVVTFGWGVLSLDHGDVYLGSAAKPLQEFDTTFLANLIVLFPWPDSPVPGPTRVRDLHVYVYIYRIYEKYKKQAIYKIYKIYKIQIMEI